MPNIFFQGGRRKILLEGRSPPAYTLVLGAKSLHLSYRGEAQTLVINNETYGKILREKWERDICRICAGRKKVGYAQEGRTNKISKNAQAPTRLLSLFKSLKPLKVAVCYS